MTAPMPLPPLPEPQRARWQPLRMGLVELYHYDCEEFWFRDGHLLLRGNNGTGKSKVLSLTLPFLLDLHVGAARVEPDGDRTKRMEWNLLMGRYERRTGYAWIEFARRGEDGAAEYLTLGCGLAAVAGKPHVETWPFITDLRIGEDLWLVSPERVVLSRERLADKLGDRGQIFRTAGDYRRAVDERLFRLGEERYRALIDTLIQLRQPQLSRRPDERTLSDALTQALPPLPQATLEDVAEALTQLDEYRRELAELDALCKDVSQFVRRYTAYARVRARREARLLRQAQTEFDTASRALAEARAELAAAAARVDAVEARIAELDRALVRDRAAVGELERDPAMRDAARLRDAEDAVGKRAQETADSASRNRKAAQALATAGADSARYRDAAQSGLSRVRSAVQTAARGAAEVGLAHEHAGAEAALQPLERLGERPRSDLEKLAPRLDAAIARRREHVAQVRARLLELDQAAAARDRGVSVREAYLDQLEAAQRRSATVDDELKQSAREHLRDWQAFLESSSILDIDDQDAYVDALETWVESLAGEHPLAPVLERAYRDRIRRLALETTDAEQQKRLIQEQREILDAERVRLLAGHQPAPPAPHTRKPDARSGREGAPLWQLLEFRDHVDEAARAGIEAALEAAGLLDAWVTPAAVVLDADTHDIVLVPRKPVTAALLDCLRPAGDDLAVAPERIETLLRSVACCTDEPQDDEAWVSPEGRFRVGPARGAWSKPAAQYLGYAAREAARRARLEAIAAEQEALDGQLAALDETLQSIQARQRRLEAKYAEAPSDALLRTAHANWSGAEAHRREAHDRYVEADARAHEAEAAWSGVRTILLRDAEDLRLPPETGALNAFEQTLSQFALDVRELAHAALDAREALARASQQEARERDARAEADYWADEHVRRTLAAEDATSRRDVLRESVGAAVQEIEQRLARAHEAVSSGETLREEASRDQNAALEARGESKQKTGNAQQTLEERQARRQTAVAQLQGFARTGLLSVAIEDAPIPEGDAPWTIDPALQLARRIEQTLGAVPAEDSDWSRIQSALSGDFNQLVQAMAAQGHQALSEQSDYGLVVHIVYRHRPERPDVLEQRVANEIAERREILTAREREVLENHLQAEVAASLQKLLQESERRVRTINAELDKRPTSTGVRFKLDWQALPEGEDGAPVGLTAARARLLQRAPDAWSVDDRRIIGEFLQNRIQIERLRDEGAGLLDHLTRALDYRRWHRFRIRRLQQGEWKPLTGPASSGERALGLTVPLFAAASSHYANADYPHAPRLVLLDEAYAGIDDEARAHCMALIREFDLDFVMTSEREWGCYAELPGLAICQLVRRDGVDAVYVSRWSWDGRVRREELDASRRIPEAAAT
ncbi:MAG TPA: TIGR02680 family protein [Burkholderiales bacterium]|nr:TIGR02680 family protein [Burkholderiales bacterium]